MVAVKYLVLILLWIVLASAAYAGLSAAPWVPSRKRHRKLLLDNFTFKNGQTVYDLGCGTGTVLIDIAKKYPSVHAIGIELSILPYVVAKLRSWHYPNVTIRYGNLFRQDISDADVVFVYLLSGAFEKLIKKLKKDLSNEALIVVGGWALPNITPERVLEQKNTLPIYLYRKQNL